MDDNIRTIDLVKTMLRGFGFERFTEATTLAEAKKILKATPPDLMLLDYMMGTEEGVTLARWLRNDPASPAPQLPIIMLTGHADRARVMAARDAGINEICVKPFTPADLIKRILTTFESPRPFVNSGSGYFGPDRRRHDDPRYKGPERRKRV
ncbi:PleD family two-component system response regulator [Phenylobacterium aquaticum]|uniref:response regulator n=1 Tax=Phenylobacterium aquaticum TaxID=1763816 RepID=UPI0026EC72C5|nr:response regulator [Phenylobacterium aquaticum]